MTSNAFKMLLCIHGLHGWSVASSCTCWTHTASFIFDNMYGVVIGLWDVYITKVGTFNGICLAFTKHLFFPERVNVDDFITPFGL